MGGDADTTHREALSEFLRGMQQSIERRLEHIDGRLDCLESRIKDADTTAAERHEEVEHQLRKIAHAVGIADESIAAGDDAEDRKRLKVRHRRRGLRGGKRSLITFHHFISL
jgi:hypothetical protein